ncbi:MAG TPA: hypothetical protein VMI75_18250 [Polyangiaceae bacterium]|nr:hypothetical protein [Polyangiaceae bacterium]
MNAPHERNMHRTVLPALIGIALAFSLAACSQDDSAGWGSPTAGLGAGSQGTSSSGGSPGSNPGSSSSGSDSGAGSGSSSGSGGPPPPQPGGFQQTVAPLLDQAGCTECHHHGRPIDLTTYPFMAGAAQDAAQQLLASLTTNMPPAPRTTAPSSVGAAVQTWIAAGMKP